MKKLLCAVFAICAGMVGAVEWQGLSAENWYSGRKLAPSDLLGKVVLVDEWGVDCGPCRALLPKMEKIWQTFKSKPFILIGSHCQGRQPAIGSTRPSRRRGPSVRPAPPRSAAPNSTNTPWA